MTKKLHIKTYGCQMNVYDSLRMADVLAPIGYSTTEDVADADMVILNTCHIREKASEKVYSELGRLREHKNMRAERGERMLIGVAGCVAQAEGEEILRRAPYVDVVVGSQAYHHLADMVQATLRSGKAAMELDFPEEPKFDLLPESAQPQGASAFISIQEGCDKFCTFCVVPYTRGAEYSRDVSAVVAEAKRAIAAGAVEITLLGQNVNAYHGKSAGGAEVGLAQLLQEIAGLNGIKRLRYTTSHPKDMTADLIRAHGEIEVLMPFLHLPVQSGSDAILKAMNRKHSAADYVRITQELRAVRPDMAFSSDFIVGFPGETERDFNDTLALVETVGFAQAYSFKYSPRPGTPAADHATHVEEAEKERRLAILQDYLNRQQEQFNRRFFDQTVTVLLDRAGREPGQRIGRTPHMQSVFLENAVHKENQLVDVRVSAAYARSLRGELVAA